MIKFDLLLLPLVGGYVFLITFYLTKFYHQRIDRQRLIFNSVIAGVLISIFGLYLNELLKLECFVCFRKFFKFLIPLKPKRTTKNSNYLQQGFCEKQGKELARSLFPA